MSDLLSAAAQAMGVPEPIAERSARARAAASGQSYEDILAAWAGGQAVAAAPAEAPAETPAEAPAEQAPAEEAPAAEPAAPAAPAAPEPAAAPAPAAAVPRAPAKPPVLEAPADQPLLPIAGGLAVLILTVLLGIVFPSLPADSDEIRSSQLALSE